MSETPITITDGREESGWPQQGAWTYSDYLRLIEGLEDGRIYELIDGHLYITNPPGASHQTAVSQVRAHLSHYAHANKRGHALTYPFRVHLSDTSRPILPDVVFVKADSWPGAKANYFKGAPDLIVEVLSPGTTRTDQVIKFLAYETAGVPEYWIVNPHTKSVQVFVLYGSEYHLLKDFRGRDVIESKVLAGVQATTNHLFE